MGKPKYEQFDVEKSPKEYGESISEGPEDTRHSSSPRSWGQIILIILLTFFIWMVVFALLGFLPMKTYTYYWPEQTADPNASQPSAGGTVEEYAVGILAIKEADTAAIFVDVEPLPSLPQEQGVNKSEADTAAMEPVGPLELPQSLPPAREEQPVEEFPVVVQPVQVVPEQALISMPLYDDADSEEGMLQEKNMLVEEDKTNIPVPVDTSSKASSIMTPDPSVLEKYAISNGDEKLTWLQAVEFCRIYGTQLVTIETEEKQAEVNQVLAAFGVPAGDMLWTSGVSGNPEGSSSEWAVTGNKVSYTNWAPHDVKYDYSGCIAIGLLNDTTKTYGWENLNCLDMNRFICEPSLIPQFDPLPSSAKPYETY